MFWYLDQQQAKTGPLADAVDIDVEMWGCVEVDEDGNGADTSAPEFSVLVRNVGAKIVLDRS